VSTKVDTYQNTLGRAGPGRADWHFADCHSLLAAWQQKR